MLHNLGSTPGHPATDAQAHLDRDFVPDYAVSLPQWHLDTFRAATLASHRRAALFSRNIIISSVSARHQNLQAGQYIATLATDRSLPPAFSHLGAGKLRAHLGDEWRGRLLRGGGGGVGGAQDHDIALPVAHDWEKRRR